MHSRLVLALDLDSTLIYSTPTKGEVETPSFQFEIPVHGHPKTFYTKIRPHAVALWRLLQDQSTTGDVKAFGVFTLATPEYAQCVVAELQRLSGSDVKPAFVLDRRSVSVDENKRWYKDLDVVRRLFPDGHVVLLDDDPIHASANQGSVALVSHYKGEDGDEGLRTTIKTLAERSRKRKR